MLSSFLGFAAFSTFVFFLLRLSKVQTGSEGRRTFIDSTKLGARGPLSPAMIVHQPPVAEVHPGSRGLAGRPSLRQVWLEGPREMETEDIFLGMDDRDWDQMEGDLEIGILQPPPSPVSAASKTEDKPTRKAIK